MIIVNGWKLLIIITKRSILDAAALDPPLNFIILSISGWVNYVLLGLTLLTMTGSLAWDIYLDQKGCCGITDACDDREVYEQLSETLETKSKQIDAIYTNGKSFI